LTFFHTAEGQGLFLSGSPLFAILFFGLLGLLALLGCFFRSGLLFGLFFFLFGPSGCLLGSGLLFGLFLVLFGPSSLLLGSGLFLGRLGPRCLSEREPCHRKCKKNANHN